MVFACLAGVGAAACSTLLGIEGAYHDRVADAGGAPSTCGDGPCSPTVLAAGARAAAIAVDDRSIYWVERGDGLDGGALRACAKPDCAAPSTLAGFTQPVAVAVAGSDAFVLASKDLAGGAAPRVYRVPKSGGAPEECSKNGAPGTPASLASADDRIFVARATELVECKTGCTAAAPCARLLAVETNAVVAHAQDKIYWSAADGVRRCTLANDACTADPTAIDPGVAPAEIVSMAADDSTIFVGVAGEIRAVARSTSQGRALASLGPRPAVALLEDASALYVATDAAIVRVGKDDGATRTIADVAGATALAIDDANVYFADPARGILSVPK